MGLSNAGGCIGPVWGAVPAAIAAGRPEVSLHREERCNGPAPQGLLLRALVSHSSSNMMFSLHAGDDMILTA
eukprot:475991-Pelagomonas_calceolata.AAC.2